MRGGSRLKYQVEQALNEINFVGQSKRALRDTGEETGVHSTTQVEHFLSVNQNFAKWLKTEKGLKDLFKLKRIHYREYIDFMKNKGVTNGHLINVETSLRLLSKGMNKVSENKGIKARDWVPKTRLIDVKTREKPVDRSHSQAEIESFREKVSNNVKVAMDLQTSFGLRLREVANTKVAHLVEIDGKLYWKAVADKNALNTAHGVTKGGRPRITPVQPQYEALVRKMIEGKGQGEYICDVRYNTLKSAYNRVGVTSHSFRHTYARSMLLKEFEKEGIVGQGRAMLQRMIENREKGYRKDHLVTRAERPLYKQVNNTINRIHSWIGHGRGRIDLVEVYMKGI